MSDPDTEETVKLEVTLSWSYSINSTHVDEYDTGITVEDWNAMTDAARAGIYNEALDEVRSQYDCGGTQVLTEGAVD